MKFIKYIKKQKSYLTIPYKFMTKIRREHYGLHWSSNGRGLEPP